MARRREVIGRIALIAMVLVERGSFARVVETNQGDWGWCDFLFLLSRMWNNVII